MSLLKAAFWDVGRTRKDFIGEYPAFLLKISFIFFQDTGLENVREYTERGKLGEGSIAQGLEHWSCKPGVASSNLAGAYLVFVFSPSSAWIRGCQCSCIPQISVKPLTVWENSLSMWMFPHCSADPSEQLRNDLCFESYVCRVNNHAFQPIEGSGVYYCSGND